MGVPGLFNYWVVIFLMMVGFYTVIARPNLVKKIAGLFIFQTSVCIMYISMAAVSGGAAPIYVAGVSTYSNPLPHVLILTAIVVGVATTALDTPPPMTWDRYQSGSIWKFGELLDEPCVEWGSDRVFRKRNQHRTGPAVKEAALNT